MQKQDSNLKVRGTLSSYKPSQFVFLRWVLMLAKSLAFHIRNFWVQGRLHFLRDSFGGVASTFQKICRYFPIEASFRKFYLNFIPKNHQVRNFKEKKNISTKQEQNNFQNLTVLQRTFKVHIYFMVEIPSAFSHLFYHLNNSLEQNPKLESNRVINSGHNP